MSRAGIVAICGIVWSLLRIANAFMQFTIRECREASPLPTLLWPGRSCVVWGPIIRVPELLHVELCCVGLMIIGISVSKLVADKIDNKAWIMGPVLAGAVYYFGMHHLGGFDYAILVESSYRFMQGQIPHRDFFCSLPPILYLPSALAFGLFGLRWYSLMILSAAFTFVTFYWLYWLLRRVHCEHAVFVAAAIECGAMLSLSFWWYNNSTSVLAACFLLSAFLWVYESKGIGAASTGARASFLISMMGLALCKPNTAALALLFGLVYVLAHDRSVIIETGLAAAGAVAILKASGISVGAMFGDYLMVATARAGGDPFIGWRINGVADTIRALAILALFIAALIASRRALRSPAFTLGCFAIAIVAMTTNGEMKEVDCALLVVAVALCYRLGIGKAWRLAALAALIASGTYMGATRYRVASIGEHQFHEWGEDPSAVQGEFFHGFQGSTHLRRAIHQSELAIEDSNNVFFGPRLEWLYVVLQKPSPAGFPVWWDPGTAFPREAMDAGRLNWADHRFDVAVFCRWDATFYDDEFERLILTNYDIDLRYSELTVFRRKANH